MNETKDDGVNDVNEAEWDVRSRLQMRSLFTEYHLSTSDDDERVAMATGVRPLTHDQKLKITQLRVLIVDDVAVDRLVLRTCLEKIGVQFIHEANQGVEGIYKSLSASRMGTPFHVIFTDWKMPRKDGIAFLKDIRGEKFKVRPFIVMLTSQAQATCVKEAKEAGVDDYVVKPIVLDVMNAKILHALDRITV